MVVLDIGGWLIKLILMILLISAVIGWRMLSNRASEAVSRAIFRGSHQRGKSETSVLLVGTTGQPLDSLRTSILDQMRSISGTIVSVDEDGDAEISVPGLFGMRVSCLFTTDREGKARAAYKVLEWQEFDGIVTGLESLQNLREAFITGVTNVEGTVEDLT